MKMQRLLKISLPLILIPFGLGCSLFHKKSDTAASPPPDSALMVQFDKGLKLLEEENYNSASLTFERILNQNPTSEFELVTMFNAGAAREGLKDCKGAADRYRKAVAGARGKFPQIESQSLYRLSFAYECLGMDAKVITSLLEVKSRSLGLGDETVLTELPARLAAAYARAGNTALSREYYDQANKGLEDLKVSFRSRARYAEVLARTLFFMGRLNLPDERIKNNAKAYIENLRTLQPYLAQSVALNAPTWSEKSFHQIANAYDTVWNYVDRSPSDEKQDKLLKENQDRRYRLMIAKEASRALENLKILNNVPLKPGSFADRLNRMVQIQEQKLTRLLSDNSVTTLPSEEARKREGLRREGRFKQ